MSEEITKEINQNETPSYECNSYSSYTRSVDITSNVWLDIFD